MTSPVRKRPPLTPRSRAVLLVAIVGSFSGLALVHPLPKSTAFCQLCGAEEIQCLWAVRGTNFGLTTGTVVATPISELLANKKLVSTHRHEWLEPRSAPDPLDEFGPPVVESLGFINTPRVVNFMRGLAEYGSPESIAQWRATLLQPEYSYVIDSALRFLLAPNEGFATREEFMRWWSRNGFALSNRLRELTEPD